MSKPQTVALGLITLLALGATGCATTWVKRADKPQPQPPQTLLASLNIYSRSPDSQVDPQDSASSAKAIAFLIQNKDLDAFGAQAQAQLSEMMLERGYALTFDKERAVRLGDSSLARNKSIQTLSGGWVHPQTSPYDFNGNYFNSALVKVAQTLRDPAQPQEHFASITIFVHEASDFACGGIMGWFYPVITVDLRVLNNQGKEVFNSRIKGEGESQFAAADRSAKNLSLGLKRALMKMKAIEVEKL